MGDIQLGMTVRRKSAHNGAPKKAAMNGCVGGDMNEDGRPDLICTGAGGMIRRYENLGLEDSGM